MNILKNLSHLRVAACAGTVLLAGLPLTAQAQSNNGGVERIHAMAAQANSGPEHAATAKEYRLQAEAFEAQAQKHEKAVARVAGQQWFRKWPAMAPQWVQKEKQAAVEARRAARELYALSDRHIGLAVETQAAD